MPEFLTRMWEWFRGLATLPQILIGAVAVVALVIASPVIWPIVGLISLAALVGFLVQLVRRRPARWWAAAAGGAFVATFLLNGIAGAVYQPAPEDQARIDEVEEPAVEEEGSPEEEPVEEEEPVDEEEPAEEEEEPAQESAAENDLAIVTIPGLTASEVALFAEDRGLECTRGPLIPEGRIEDMNAQALQALTAWGCTRQDGDIEYTLYYSTTEDNEVWSIEAAVWDLADIAAEPVAAYFLAEVAALPDEATDPAQARQWVAQNIDSDQVEEVTLGGTYYALRGSGVGPGGPPITWDLSVESADRWSGR